MGIRSKSVRALDDARDSLFDRGPTASQTIEASKRTGEYVEFGEVLTMQSLYRYAFGLVVCAASCGQILDVDAEYELDPNAGGTAGNENCGDGTTTGTEVCDDGNKVDGDGCDSNCTPTNCGNGIKAGEEECDDGNVANDDECTALCRIAICGDGVVRPSEQCDDGNAVDGDDCDSNCTISGCGNGIKTVGESCDDGNLMNGDGCSSACTTEEACGNGIVDMGEECDDMNLNDGDGCSAACTIEGMCGNGTTDGIENCDDGNILDGDGCDSNCTMTACGNGILTMGEQCDDANLMNGDGCDSNCTPTACGNGIVSAGEQCDDGNVLNGDACDSTCKETICGNGKISAGEQCDDGNQINNDGCSNTCRITPSSCLNLPETCGPQQNEDCCKNNYVQGGTFNRINNSSYPATLNSFRLDRFEVTVGRFRKFVEGYPQNKPVANAGENPLVPASGWSDAWNPNLPADGAALRSALTNCSAYTVWSDAPNGREIMPINCMTWYEAFAFCAWDGGFLPTEAEWNYAAAGGSEQRYYPWGAAAATATYANYNCYGDGSAAQDCKIADILPVGSKSTAGDGLWGHADLAGSMKEWTRDTHTATLMNPCTNCANMTAGADRAVRGGSWGAGSANLANQSREAELATSRSSYIGFRCGRGL